MLEARQYPVDCGHLLHPQPRNRMPANQPIHQGPIVSIAFSSGWSGPCPGGRGLPAHTHALLRYPCGMRLVHVLWTAQCIVTCM